MGFAAVFHVLHGCEGRLFGIDDLQPRYIFSSQFIPDHFGQRADGGVIYIGNLQLSGIQLVSRSHAADDGHLIRPGFFDQHQLGGNRINGVHHVIKAGKIKFPGSFRCEKAGAHIHPGLGINRKDALFHNLHLFFPDGGAGGDQLAVDIGQAHLVVVHQHEGTYTAPGKGLRCIGTHAADSENRYGGVF